MSDCCGGEISPPKYSLSLKTDCNTKGSTLWQDASPPTGDLPCHFRMAFDGEGNFYVRSGDCGGWIKQTPPADNGSVTEPTAPDIKVVVNGETIQPDATGCITLPDYPVAEPDTDTDTHVTVSIAGTAYPEVDGNIDLPAYPDVPGATGVTGVTVNGEAQTVTDGVVEITVAEFDLCLLPPVEDESPCCTSFIPVCRETVDDNGDPTGEAEAVLMPLAHCFGVFSANDDADGLANTCSGQHYIVTNGDGTRTLFINTGTDGFPVATA